MTASSGAWCARRPRDIWRSKSRTPRPPDQNWDKGTNLPDTELSLSPLTQKGLRDLQFAAANAQIVGLSFIHGPDDVLDLVARLGEMHAEHLGILLKVETGAGFENLTAYPSRRASVSSCGGDGGVRRSCGRDGIRAHGGGAGENTVIVRGGAHSGNLGTGARKPDEEGSAVTGRGERRGEPNA